MSPSDQPRRMGRPQKAEGDRKSATMRFRVREALRERLESRAAAAGRTVNEEAEIRLERSMLFEPAHRIVFDPPNSSAFMMHLVNAIAEIQQHKDAMGNPIGSSDWKNHDPTRAALRSALFALIDHEIPRPREAEEVMKVENGVDRPLTALERKQYASAVEYMNDFGAEYVAIITGQRPDITGAVSPDSPSGT